MATEGGSDLLLFVAGEPDSGVGSTRDVETSVFRRMVGVSVGGWWRRAQEGTARLTDSAQPRRTVDPPWHLPPQQTQCVNLVFEIARSAGRRVALVDVNRAAEHQDLVDRLVGSGGVFPLLVRRDGARLQGIEAFVPRKVRRFVGGP